ncbi:MAG: hypothetical protein H7Y10_03500 [Flavobacterium sp.]|nr:hypothetical protein [Flavobacterium sp.]
MADFRVRVGHYGESDKAFGVLVDFFLDPKGNHSASRLEWFPKSVSSLERVEVENHFPEFYLTAPEWLLKKNKVKYEL